MPFIIGSAYDHQSLKQLVFAVRFIALTFNPKEEELVKNYVIVVQVILTCKVDLNTSKRWLQQSMSRKVESKEMLHFSTV